MASPDLLVYLSNPHLVCGKHLSQRGFCLSLQEVVMLLLKYNACPTTINGTAQIPKDVTQSEEIKSMLEGKASISVVVQAISRSFQVVCLGRTL